MDYMIRATAADAQIRAFAVTSRDLVEYAREAHDLSPVAAAALGRTMSAALMMADMLKGPQDLLTLKIDGDGPIGGILVTADNHGGVKGYVLNPAVDLPNHSNGHLNVGGAVGRGTLTVIRDMGMKDPYVGQTAIQTGEIAEDITYYYAASEQIPSQKGEEDTAGGRFHCPADAFRRGGDDLGAGEEPARDRRRDEDAVSGGYSRTDAGKGPGRTESCRH